MVETNRYATTCIGDSWEPITPEELCAYFGFMMLMGLVKLPSIYDYWQKDLVYHYSPIADRISRKRFFDIHRFIHFANNATLSAPGSSDYDKLGKIRPILTSLTDRFSAIYEPGKDLSIDEAMIPYKGRSSLKQYMPNKPVKRGIKIWMRAEAVNGYVSALKVYTGKTGKGVEHGLGSSVVKHLSEDLHHTYRHLYFDNFFSSVDLLLDLLRVGLYGCGTLRSNRKGFPKDLAAYVKKGLKKRGDSVSRTNQGSNIAVSIWQDNRPVVLISSNSDPTCSETVLRKKRDGTRDKVPCPTSIALYNKYMGGVDRNDQLRGYYHVPIKCRKYYKYIFWFLLDLASTNAYILAKQYTTLKISNMKTFRQTLAKELIGSYAGRKRPGRPSLLPASSKRFCLDHFPTKGEKQQRCQYCSWKKQRRCTVWQCTDCKAFLCHTGRDDDCFFLFHKQRCI